MTSRAAAPAAAGSARHLWRLEAGALSRLAFPLILANLGWSLIAGTDLFWLGKLGPEAVAAGSLALGLYQPFLLFGLGLVTAASPLIASERGRKLHSVRDIRRTVRQTWWAAVAFSLLSWVVLWWGEDILIAMGQDRQLSAQGAELLRGLQWALLPYLGFLVLRNFTSALERPYWSVVVMLLAIPVNGLAGWALIFGHLGAPRLGLFGAGLASSISTFFLFLGMAAVVLRDRSFRRFHLFGRFWVSDWPRLRRIAVIGLPIAITLTLEVAVFSGATFLMGLIGEAALAAHAVAVQIITPFFMIPVGIGQAASVRVAFAQGRADAAAVGRAGWLAYLLGTGIACLSALLLVTMPHVFIGLFLNIDSPSVAGVVRLAVSFLMVAAIFQFADAAQVIGSGVLRGLQDTRAPMLFALFGYWVAGLGAGTLLSFTLGLGGVGIWLGLAVGLATVALLMLLRWTRRDRLATMRALTPPAR